MAAPCLLAAVYLGFRADEASTVLEAQRLEASGEAERALSAAKRASPEPPNGALLATRARALASRGRTDAAVRAYREAVRRRPSDWLLRRDLAVTLAAQGSRDEARTQMARALTLNPRMSFPPGFARRSDVRKLRRQQRRAARAIDGVSAPLP